MLLLLALTWGNSFLFIKLAVSAFPPLWVVTLRMTIGGLLLVLVGIALRRKLPRDPKMLGALAFVGLSGSALPWAGQAWAQQFLDSGLLSVLNSCTPVATLALAVAVGQERLHRNRVLGLATAISGTLVVIRGEIGAGRSALALVVAVLATTGYAFASVYTRAKISGKITPLPASATQLCIGAAALAPGAWAVYGPPPAPTTVPPLALGAVLMLGLFGTGVAFLMYFTLIERVGATNTSMVTYLVPIVGLSSGAVVRHERFGPNVFIGALLLVSGVWLAQKRPAG